MSNQIIRNQLTSHRSGERPRGIWAGIAFDLLTKDPWTASNTVSVVILACIAFMFIGGSGAPLWFYGLFLFIGLLSLRQTKNIKRFFSAFGDKAYVNPHLKDLSRDEFGGGVNNSVIYSWIAVVGGGTLFGSFLSEITSYIEIEVGYMLFIAGCLIFIAGWSANTKLKERFEQLVQAARPLDAPEFTKDEIAIAWEGSGLKTTRSEAFALAGKVLAAVAVVFLFQNGGDLYELVLTDISSVPSIVHAYYLDGGFTGLGGEQSSQYYEMKTNFYFWMLKLANSPYHFWGVAN